jgi:hypothetical protein
MLAHRGKMMYFLKENMIFQELKINTKIAFFARGQGGKMRVNIKTGEGL